MLQGLTRTIRQGAFRRRRRRTFLKPRHCVAICLPALIFYHIFLWYDFGMPASTVDTFASFAAVHYLCSECGNKSISSCCPCCSCRRRRICRRICRRLLPHLPLPLPY
eukprot:SAG22_NODE_1796_length_3550_cov_3.789047_3_plen_108_part_00